MKTDDLIATLGNDLTRVQPRLLATGMFRGVAAGLVMTVAIFIVFWGFRPDWDVILRDLALFAKSALPFGLGVLAMPWALAKARPGGNSRSKWAVLALAIVLGLGMSASLYSIPSQQWWSEFLGSSIVTCLISIPALSAPVLAGALFFLRRGAPESPTRCGAVAGLMAAGFGAAVYSLFCIEDSPLFYGVWYTLAILVVSLAGALAGGRLLQW